jgi:hypothetical protein
MLNHAMLDLILPLECGGCGAPSTRWCTVCGTALAVQPDEPHVVSTRIDPGVPVFALGRYAGARRNAIVALKEHGRRDLAAPLSAKESAALGRLAALGGVFQRLLVQPLGQGAGGDGPVFAPLDARQVPRPAGRAHGVGLAAQQRGELVDVEHERLVHARVSSGLRTPLAPVLATWV